MCKMPVLIHLIAYHQNSVCHRTHVLGDYFNTSAKFLFPPIFRQRLPHDLFWIKHSPITGTWACPFLHVAPLWASASNWCLDVRVVPGALIVCVCVNDWGWMLENHLCPFSLIHFFPSDENFKMNKFLFPIPCLSLTMTSIFSMRSLSRFKGRKLKMVEGKLERNGHSALPSHCETAGRPHGARV